MRTESVRRSHCIERNVTKQHVKIYVMYAARKPRTLHYSFTKYYEQGSSSEPGSALESLTVFPLINCVMVVPPNDIEKFWQSEPSSLKLCVNEVPLELLNEKNELKPKFPKLWLLFIVFVLVKLLCAKAAPETNMAKATPKTKFRAYIL